MSAFFLEKKIVIYGAGDLASRIVKVLLKDGIEVEFFIDKRANVYDSYKGKPVLSLDGAFNKDNKEDYVVIIAVKNAYEHNNIVRELINEGYVYFIFKPLSVLNGNNKDSKLDAIMNYHSMITDEYEYENWQLYSIYEYSLDEDVISSVIKCENGKVWTYVPSELVLYKMGSCESVFQAAMYPNRVAVKMYEEFQSGFLNEDSEGLTMYLEEARNASLGNGMAIDEEWENSFISGKLSIYHNMNRLVALSPDFFINNCAEVALRKPTSFEIVSSGKNRVSFLMAKGYKFIPVCMSDEDYIRYQDVDTVETIKSIIKDKTLAFPIPHVNFMERETQAEDYVKLWLIRIARYLFFKEGASCVDDLYVNDACCDYGTTARYLSTIGFDVLYNPKTEFERALCRLFQFNDNSFCQQKEYKKKYSIVIYSNRDNSEKIDDYIDDDTKYLFIQNWNGWGIHINDLIKVKFEIDKPIFSTIWNGKKVCGYVCKKKL